MDGGCATYFSAVALRDDFRPAEGLKIGGGGSCKFSTTGKSPEDVNPRNQKYFALPEF